MSTNLWELFPYPTLTESGPVDGALLDAHPDCVRCPTRECLEDEGASVSELFNCRFGITYAPIDDSRVVAGVICQDLPLTTGRAKKRLRREQSRKVRSSDVRRAIERARSLGVGVTDDFEGLKREILERVESDPTLHEALAAQLRTDFSDHLSRSHDFLQLVKLVRGHAEALLHEKFPGLPPAAAADKLPTEGAIYYSTELMLAKMDSLAFLNEVNRALGGERKFKIHPFLLKYVRIYDWQARQKDLKLRLEGTCHAECYYNDQAIGAILQGLLDNLVKYAPAGSKATVTFDESDQETIHLAFISLGPKIEESERRRIFLPQFRAKAASELELSGMGVGLATAQQISDALDLRLDVEQDEHEDAQFPSMYRTTFSFTLEKAG